MNKNEFMMWVGGILLGTRLGLVGTLMYNGKKKGKEYGIRYVSLA